MFFNLVSVTLMRFFVLEAETNISEVSIFFRIVCTIILLYKSIYIMKIKLFLLLLAVFTVSINAQTFDWEGGTTINGGKTYVRQTVSGVQAECTNSSNDLQHLAGGGFAGSSGYVVSCGPNTSSLTVTFDAVINIQSIYALDGNASANDDWTFTPNGGSNSNVVQSIGGSTGVNLNVNWTNVTAFTITSANGFDRFTIDDIVFTVPPCNVNIPDVNFKNYLIGNTNINTDRNSEISCAEATAFTGTIRVTNLGISDLTGIETFTNIKVLFCDDNSLSALDVSANTALEELYCDTNLLTSLDVSNNVALETLSCPNNSQLVNLNVSGAVALKKIICVNNTSLTNLNVSTNTALENLFCFSNSLTSLDISNNTALIKLYCYSNSLTSLNLANGNNSNMFIDANYPNYTNNPNLTCIQVDDVNYANTNWNVLKDASASFSTNCFACNVNIPDANFKAALVADTTINTDGDTEISCSEATAVTGNVVVINKSISDLTGIEAFTNITGLYCRDNALTSLDVSANIALTTLVCRNNLLTSLDVSANTSLNYLECQVNSLTNLNLANGNNSLMGSGRFFAAANSNLTCIQVDNEAFSLANWTNSVDAGVSFSTNCATASIDNFFLNKVSIYPNPSISVLNIKMNSNLKRATIYSVLGSKILETTSKNIKILNLNRGLYLIKIVSENGSVSTKRFMKE